MDQELQIELLACCICSNILCSSVRRSDTVYALTRWQHISVM